MLAAYTRGALRFAGRPVAAASFICGLLFVTLGD